MPEPKEPDRSPRADCHGSRTTRHSRRERERAHTSHARALVSADGSREWGGDLFILTVYAVGASSEHRHHHQGPPAAAHHHLATFTQPRSYGTPHIASRRGGSAKLYQSFAVLGRQVGHSPYTKSYTYTTPTPPPTRPTHPTHTMLRPYARTTYPMSARYLPPSALKTSPLSPIRKGGIWGQKRVFGL